MAIKTVEFEEHWYIPESERAEDKPFAILACPLNKGEYDAYQRDFRTKIGRKGSFDIDRTSATVKVWRNRIRELRNVIIHDDLVERVIDKEQILWVMKHLADNDVAGEIEDFLLGLSSLSPEEEANFTLGLGLEKSPKTKTEETNPSGQPISKVPVTSVETNAIGQGGDSA